MSLTRRVPGLGPVGEQQLEAGAGTVRLEQRLAVAHESEGRRRGWARARVDVLDEVGAGSVPSVTHSSLPLVP